MTTTKPIYQVGFKTTVKEKWRWSRDYDSAFGAVGFIQKLIEELNFVDGKIYFVVKEEWKEER